MAAFIGKSILVLHCQVKRK